MPIESFPFQSLKGESPRPWLPVRLFNPHKKRHIDYFALIDTGADACVIPRSFAEMIGHNYEDGEPTESQGVGGCARGFIHTIKITILDLEKRTPVLDVNNDRIKCFEAPCILLGVKGFLERFILEIDYPRNTLRLKHYKRSRDRKAPKPSTAPSR